MSAIRGSFVDFPFTRGVVSILRGDVVVEKHFDVDGRERMEVGFLRVHGGMVVERWRERREERRPPIYEEVAIVVLRRIELRWRELDEARDKFRDVENGHVKV
jgi:hypothetical protein